MKLIVRKTDMVAIAAYPDTTRVLLDGEKLITPTNVEHGRNRSNTIIYTVDAIPEDFTSRKYFYNGTAFALNPEYLTQQQGAEQRDTDYSNGDPFKAEKIADWNGDHIR